MNRFEIVGVGYTNASQMLGDANRFAAVAADGLSDALAGSGAMAGDSSFASEFAAAYDEAAVGVLSGFDDAVGALSSLCRLAYCSFENHRRAEESSIATTVVVSSSPSALSTALYATASPAPPASLGGDASYLPGWANVILDHVEGFVWPDADVDRLRSTADAWRLAAGQLDYVVDLTGCSIDELYEERSPEVPLAADAIARLRDGIRVLAAACDQIAAMCDQYADAVETQRDLILDLVKDLIRDAILIQAAGFVLGLVTGGSTNAVAAWINSGKLAAHVPRFKALVEAVRVCAAGAATTMRAAVEPLVRAQATFRRMKQARILVSGLERGAVSLGKDVTWLRRHEGGPMGAHTLAKHVGKSDRYLRRRLQRGPDLRRVSTFTDEAAATRGIRTVLSHHSDEIKAWLANSSSGSFARQQDVGAVVGRVMTRDGATHPGRIVRLVLRKDPQMPDGFRVFTCYIVG